MIPAGLPSCEGYVALGLLGEGAMSQVFLAEQILPVQRRVALKVLRWNAAAETFGLRFEAERQALAWLEDDRIARLLDSGTTADGRPFLAIEYVQGLPITTYCDQQQMAVLQRIELFLEACQAVHHAHQRGILHRDLKPGHVLVANEGGRPKIKVIDFGIAKMLAPTIGPTSHRTEQGEILGTPEYMAPEQAEGGSLAVDVRADVYALGAVLHEILTGELPVPSSALRGQDWLTIRARLRTSRRLPMSAVVANEYRPEAAERRRLQPRDLVRTLRGSLDAVVLHATAALPGDRYGSAEALAADLRAWMEQRQPTVLRGATWQAVRLFARRQRRAIVLAAGVLLVLLISAWTVVTTLGRETARLERMRLEARDLRVRAEALQAALQGDPELDRPRWQGILEQARLAAVSAAAIEDDAQMADARNYLRTIETQSIESERRAILAKDKRTFEEALERGWARWWSGSLTLTQGVRDELLELLDTSPLLGRSGRFGAAILPDEAYCRRVETLVRLLLGSVLIQQHYTLRAVARLREQDLIRHIGAAVVETQVSLAESLTRRLRAAAESLPGADPGCDELLRALEAAVTAPRFPASLLRHKPRGRVESLLMAELLFNQDPLVDWRRAELDRLSGGAVDRLFAMLSVRFPATERAKGQSAWLLTTAPEIALGAFPSEVGSDLWWPTLQAAARTTNDADILASHAFVAALRGDVTGARESLTRISVAASSDRHLYRLSIAHQALGENQRCIDLLREAVTRAPLSARCWCNLGYHLIAARDFPGGFLARRIGHAIGSALDCWPFPSERWVAEAEAFARSTVPFQNILDGLAQPSSPGDLTLAFRFAVLTEQFDAALALFDRMAAPGPGTLDEPWLLNCVEAAQAAARAAVRPGTSSMGAAAARSRAMELVSRVVDPVWRASADPAGRAIGRRVAMTIRRHVELMALAAQADEGSAEEAERRHQLWRRVEILRQQ